MKELVGVMTIPKAVCFGCGVWLSPQRYKLLPMPNGVVKQYWCLKCYKKMLEF